MKLASFIIFMMILPNKPAITVDILELIKMFPRRGKINISKIFLPKKRQQDLPIDPNFS